MRRLLLAGVALLVATPAAAQGDARFCPNRPSLGASGCTTLPGQVQVELSGIDWERDDQPDRRTDTLLYGDITARIGVTDHAELQIGVTPLASVRTRDRATGDVQRVSGAGDVTIGIRRAFSGADGKGLSSAIQPFVVLPTGSAGIGAGDWSAGAIVPVSYEIDDRWTVDFTGELMAQADQDGAGRHLNANGVVGLGYAITDAVTATTEVYLERDDDHAGHVTRMLAAESLAWQPTGHTQLDVLAVAGLNHDRPDFRVVLGGAILF